MKQCSYFLLCLTLLVSLIAGFTQVKAQQPGWQATASLSTARFEHTTTLLRDGKVLVVGGISVYNPCCRVTNSAELYDPVTGQWSVTGSPNAPRHDHVAVRLADGKVLIVGGQGATSSLLSRAEIYDPHTGTWSAVGSLGALPSNPRAVLLTDGRVLITGATRKTAEVYDPATNLWSRTGPMNVQRYSHSLTLLPNGRVLAAGGGITIGDSRTAEIYDPATNAWAPTGELREPRIDHQATLLPNGKVLVAGGSEGSVIVSAQSELHGQSAAAQIANDSSQINYIAAAELYDPITEQWSTTGSLIIPRSLHTLTLLTNGKVLVAGGVGGFLTLNRLSISELYDPAIGRWTLTASLNVGRGMHTATLLPNGKVLAAGGEPSISLSGPLTLASAELFDSGTPTIVSISAASFTVGPLTPEAIVAGFGANLAASTQAAAGLPLPTELAGVSVRVRDSAGIERAAPLFFISPNQINYQIPVGTANGPATITVSNSAVGLVEIGRFAPGLFAANANGQGLAAAVALRIKADGAQGFEPVAQFDAQQQRFIATPIDLSLTSNQVFLILYGTGIRSRSALSAVNVSIGETNGEVLFADAAPGFVGLDQINVRLPHSLAGRGEVDVVLTVDGWVSNKVRVSIR